MSKSYLNFITVAAEADEIKQQVNAMITDPNRLRKTDPGNPDVCIVDKYHGIYVEAEHQDIREQCQKGGIGCVQCKRRLMDALDIYQQPIRERRNEVLKKPSLLDEILEAGNIKAREAAQKTMEDVRNAIGI
jgi:tryptophanyl-tRNA synthetase